MVEQLETLISGHTSELDVVLLRNENEVETKKVAELMGVLLIRTRCVTKT